MSKKTEFPFNGNTSTLPRRHMASTIFVLRGISGSGGPKTHRYCKWTQYLIKGSSAEMENNLGDRQILFLCDNYTWRRTGACRRSLSLTVGGLDLRLGWSVYNCLVGFLQHFCAVEERVTNKTSHFVFTARNILLSLCNSCFFRWRFLLHTQPERTSQTARCNDSLVKKRLHIWKHQIISVFW